LDRLAFQQQLAARKLQIHYGEEELDSDLRTVERQVAEQLRPGV